MDIDQYNYARELGYDNKVKVTFDTDGTIRVDIDNSQLLIQLILVLFVIIIWHGYMSLYTIY